VAGPVPGPPPRSALENRTMPGSFAAVRDALKSRDRRGVLVALGEVLDHPDVRLVLPQIEEEVQAACRSLAEERARLPEGEEPKDIAFETGPWSLQFLRDLWELVVRGGASPRRSFCLITPENGRWVFRLLHALLGDSELGRSAHALFFVLPRYVTENDAVSEPTECYLDLFETLWLHGEHELRGRLPLTSELMDGPWKRRNGGERPPSAEARTEEAGDGVGAAAVAEEAEPDEDPCSIEKLVESLDRLDWMILHTPDEPGTEVDGEPADLPVDRIDVEALGEEVRSTIRELEESLLDYPDRWLLEDVENVSARTTRAIWPSWGASTASSRN